MVGPGPVLQRLRGGEPNEGLRDTEVGDGVVAVIGVANLVYVRGPALVLAYTSNVC
jgi:hypothetical protein